MFTQKVFILRSEYSAHETNEHVAKAGRIQVKTYKKVHDNNTCTKNNNFLKEKFKLR
jgi:hypothetical protein